jgi:hypothetical protein
MATDSTFDGTGLRVLTQDETLDNMRETIAQNPDIGPDVSTGPYSVAGMILEAAAPEIADTNDLLETVYQGWDLDSAEGAQLDNIGQLNGLTRQAATRSIGELTLGDVPGTIIPVGNKFQIPQGEEVRLREEVTIGGGGTVSANAEAVNAGPLDFGVDSITEIVDAVTGLTSVTNPAAFDVGNPQESDSLYRARIKRSHASGGHSTDAAIRTRLEDLDDVTGAVAISNRTLVTDANGTPGKTVWIIVDGTADAETIALTIWGPAGLPAGIDSRGAHVATVTDANGYAQTVRWDDATTVRTYYDAVLTKGAGYPSGGDALVAQAIVDWGASQLNLAGAVWPQPIDSFVAAAVPGIAKLVIRLSRTNDPPLSTETDPLVMAVNERATIDLADVDVTAT